MGEGHPRKQEVGSPVQTCSESRQPAVEEPEHPAYHLSFHLLQPAGGMERLPFLGHRLATESLRSGCRFRLQPQLHEATPGAAFQRGESGFHAEHPMTEQEGCDGTQEGS